MNKTAQRLGAWGGIVSIVALAIGFWWIAGFLPPPRPSLDPRQVADYFDQNRQRIRIGMLVSMWGSTLLMPWAAVVHLQLKRIEGRFPVFSNTQIVMLLDRSAEPVFPRWAGYVNSVLLLRAIGLQRDEAQTDEAVLDMVGTMRTGG
jgi:hypothetical protein